MFSVIGYVGATSLTTRLVSFVGTIVTHLEIGWMWFFSVVGWLWVVVKHRKNVGLIVLGVCSGLSIMGGGVVYFHHFLQLFLFQAWLGFECLGKIKRRIVGWIIVVGAVLCLLGWGAFVMKISGVAYGLSERPVQIPELLGARYLVVFPYYPRFYFDYKLKAPDRYFNGLLLSRTWSGGNSTNQENKIGRASCRERVSMFV
jgi:hypothetical protein